MKNFQKNYQQDENYKDDLFGSFSPLHYAAKKNLKEIGKIFILKEEDINAKDINYRNIIILLSIKVIYNR